MFKNGKFLLGTIFLTVIPCLPIFGTNHSQESAPVTVAAIEFLPFHSDETRNFEIRGRRELILTKFYRNKMEVLERTRHNLTEGEAEELLRTIRGLEPDPAGTTIRMGGDQLRIAVEDGRIRHFSLPDNRKAQTLLEKMEALARNGQAVDRAAAHAKLEQVRPLSSARGQIPALTLDDFAEGPAEALRRTAAMPLRFTPLNPGLYDDLLRSTNGHRLFVLKDEGHFYEIRLYPDRRHPAKRKPRK